MGRDNGDTRRLDSSHAEPGHEEHLLAQHSRRAFADKRASRPIKAKIVAKRMRTLSDSTSQAHLLVYDAS